MNVVAPGVAPDLEALIALYHRAHGLNLSPARRSPEPLTGAYLSRFRARGMEYSESRAYLPGDDIRNMDWRVTARTGRPHTKLFQEERERPVILIVDLSPSMFFGTRVTFKSVIAAQAGALIAWAAVRSGDRIGALICAPNHTSELRPAGGRRGAMRVLRELCARGRPEHAPGAPGQSRLLEAVTKARRVARPGGLVFVLSDFYDLNQETEQQLARLRRHVDLVGVLVLDPLEIAPPPPARYAISDGADSAILDSRDRTVSTHYRDHFAARRNAVHTAFARLGAAHLELRTDEPADLALQRGLRRMTGATGAARATRSRVAGGALGGGSSARPVRIDT